MEETQLYSPDRLLLEGTCRLGVWDDSLAVQLVLHYSTSEHLLILPYQRM